MNKEIIKFREFEIKEHKFLVVKVQFSLEGVDTDDILIPNKISSVEKKYQYFIGYMDDDHKIKPFNLILPKASAYVKSCDGETN